MANRRLQAGSILAHELRNPLTAIRAAADALGLMKLEDPKVERLLERLDRQSMIMTRMLDDLLDAARIASGKTSVQIEDIVLNDLLYEIAAVLQAAPSTPPLAHVIVACADT
jgi:two-component system, sensor histidine kinase